MKKSVLITILLSLITVSALQAQETKNDSLTSHDSVFSQKELRRQRVAKRNFHYNILGGPSYSPDFGLLVGGSALMTFSIQPSDSTLKRSVLPMTIAFIFDGGINLFMKPQLFFKNDRFRIFGKFSYKNTQENYYGVGYSTNKNYVRSDTTSQYRYSGVQINPWFLFRLGNTNLFAGPQIDINYDHFTNPGKYLAMEESYTDAGGDAHGYKNFNSGLGFLLTYDSRDVPSNAYRGMYLDFRGMMYHKIFGSDKNFYRLELDYRQYKQIGERKVIAWTAQSKNVFGKDIPLTQYSLTGTPFDLRGYYMGQYRDKSSHVVLAEYRQMFNTDEDTWLKRIIQHLGFVAWAGCGFMGPTATKVEGVLPNYGVGLRIEVQPRMNVRLDLGKNTVNNQTLFYFNMTEAF
ncbi:outer membrane protein assembly factor [Bacteroides sp. ET71]|uniref:BamA/TamA family outer membrane protein n=1 Tax=Bacteroides sp. ET71 TaxID=2939421 RepID=UPI0020132998|nr:BamA/TamA family outer membrane protein [Bacteroides sp. ET71]MCL1616717.1 outer membrane protein assembly factor [Bacteroides sp. ET71]